MLVAMFAAVSCQKSELTTQNGSGDEVTVNISAVMQSDNATTRLIDDNGKASEINRCIMEIYTVEEDATPILYARMEEEVNDLLEASFSLRLIPDVAYDFVFWADCATEDSEGVLVDNHYNTTSLKEITADFSDYNGNDETRDAFFASVNKTITASQPDVSAELYRPFGQVNVLTYVTNLPAEKLPASVCASYVAVAQTFNAFDGTASGETTLTWSENADVVDSPTVGSSEQFHLSTDYIFAPASGQALVEFAMEFFDANGASIMVNDKFTNIPIQRNYRTNISGELLTLGSDIDIDVTPDLDGDHNVDATTVETVAEVASELDVVKEGDDANVTVSGEVTGESNHIVVPDAVADKTGETSITVTFENVADGAKISFGGSDSSTSSTYDGTVYINAPDGVTFSDLTINLTSAHVVFNGVAYDINEGTSGTTFVVAEGASIVNLTVNAGNVDVYGTVTTIAQGDGNDGITEVTIYTQGKGLDHALEMVGNLEALQANTTEFKVKVLDNHNIQNATTGEYFGTIEEAVAAANENEVIELAEGTYTLTQDPNITNDYYNPDGFYLLINTDGLTIRGLGEVIIDSEDYQGDDGTDYAKQNLVTVRANDVTLENLTFYANTNHAYTHDGVIYPNKTIELPSGKYFGLTVDGCTFLGADGSKTSGAGRFYLGAKTVVDTETQIATIKNSKFYCGAISVHTGVATIENCEFNDVYFNAEYGTDNSYSGDGAYCVWARNRAQITIKNSSFNDVEQTHTVTDNYSNEYVYAAVMLTGEYYDWNGTNTNVSSIVIDGATTFPTKNGTYWWVTNSNYLEINSGRSYPLIFNNYNGTSYNTISEAIEDADSGDDIFLEDGVFEEDLTIDKSLKLIGYSQRFYNGSRITTEGFDLNNEAHIKGTISLADNAELDVELTGLYFDGDSHASTISGYVPTINLYSINSLTIKNCLANEIKGVLLHSEGNSAYPKNKLTISGNYIKGVNPSVTNSEKTHIFVHNVKEAEVYNNYFATASRGVHITYTDGTTALAYDDSYTQINIHDNEFYDLWNYAIQTPYYSFGKVVINNNSFEKIRSAGDEDGTINIRGYEEIQTGTLTYEYDITDNKFKDVQHAFFIRTYNKSNADAPLTVGENVNITGNEIILNTTEGDTYRTQTVFECDGTGYLGTIDFSGNSVTGFLEGETFSDYVVLNEGASLIVPGGETLSGSAQ